MQTMQTMQTKETKATIIFQGCAPETMPHEEAVALFRASRMLDEPCDLVSNGKTTKFRDIPRPDRMTTRLEVKAANRVLCWQTLAIFDELAEEARLLDDSETDPCIQLGDYYIAPEYKLNLYRSEAERWLLLDAQGECVKDNLRRSEAIEVLLVLAYRKELSEKLGSIKPACDYCTGRMPAHGAVSWGCACDVTEEQFAENYRFWCD